MAAPVAASIRIPNDSGNTGPRVQTQSEVVGADTVHAHFFIQRRRSRVLGVYRVSSVLQSVQAAAQNGTSTGFAWFHMPLAVSGKSARLREIRIEFNNIGVTAMATVPRIGVARFAFTGSASGATIAPAKVRALDPAPSLDIRSAVTGLTVILDPTPGSLLGTVLVPAGLLAGAAASFSPHLSIPQFVLRTDEEDEWTTLAPGEGAVLYQLDAGTAADSRRFVFNSVWDEIDTA